MSFPPQSDETQLQSPADEEIDIQLTSERKPAFVASIRFKGRNEQIKVYDDDSLTDVAKAFCQKHNITDLRIQEHIHEELVQMEENAQRYIEEENLATAEKSVETTHSPRSQHSSTEAPTTPSSSPNHKSPKPSPRLRILPPRTENTQQRDNVFERLTKIADQRNADEKKRQETIEREKKKEEKRQERRSKRLWSEIKRSKEDKEGSQPNVPEVYSRWLTQLADKKKQEEQKKRAEEDEALKRKQRQEHLNSQPVKNPDGKYVVSEYINQMSQPRNPRSKYVPGQPRQADVRDSPPLDSEYTFQPKLNTNSHAAGKESGTFVERMEKDFRDREEKMNELREKLNQEYSFKPELKTSQYWARRQRNMNRIHHSPTKSDTANTTMTISGMPEQGDQNTQMLGSSEDGVIETDIAEGQNEADQQPTEATEQPTPASPSATSAPSLASPSPAATALPSPPPPPPYNPAAVAAAASALEAAAPRRRLRFEEAEFDGVDGTSETASDEGSPTKAPTDAANKLAALEDELREGEEKKDAWEEEEEEEDHTEEEEEGAGDIDDTHNDLSLPAEQTGWETDKPQGRSRKRRKVHANIAALAESIPADGSLFRGGWLTAEEYVSLPVVERLQLTSQRQLARRTALDLRDYPAPPASRRRHRTRTSQTQRQHIASPPHAPLRIDADRREGGVLRLRPLNTAVIDALTPASPPVVGLRTRGSGGTPTAVLTMSDALIPSASPYHTFQNRESAATQRRSTNTNTALSGTSATSAASPPFGRPQTTPAVSVRQTLVRMDTQQREADQAKKEMQRDFERRTKKAAASVLMSNKSRRMVENSRRTRVKQIFQTLLVGVKELTEQLIREKDEAEAIGGAASKGARGDDVNGDDADADAAPMVGSPVAEPPHSQPHSPIPTNTPPRPTPATPTSPPAQSPTSPAFLPDGTPSSTAPAAAEQRANGQERHVTLAISTPGVSAESLLQSMLEASPDVVDSPLHIACYTPTAEDTPRTGSFLDSTQTPGRPDATVSASPLKGKKATTRKSRKDHDGSDDVRQSVTEDDDVVAPQQSAAVVADEEEGEDDDAETEAAAADAAGMEGEEESEEEEDLLSFILNLDVPPLPSLLNILIVERLLILYSTPSAVQNTSPEATTSATPSPSIPSPLRASASSTPAGSPAKLSATSAASTQPSTSAPAAATPATASTNPFNFEPSVWNALRALIARINHIVRHIPPAPDDPANPPTSTSSQYTSTEMLPPLPPFMPNPTGTSTRSLLQYPFLSQDDFLLLLQPEIASARHGNPLLPLVDLGIPILAKPPPPPTPSEEQTDTAINSGATSSSPKRRRRQTTSTRAHPATANGITSVQSTPSHSASDAASPPAPSSPHTPAPYVEPSEYYEDPSAKPPPYTPFINATSQRLARARREKEQQLLARTPPAPPAKRHTPGRPSSGSGKSEQQAASALPTAVPQTSTVAPTPTASPRPSRKSADITERLLNSRRLVDQQREQATQRVEQKEREACTFSPSISVNPQLVARGHVRARKQSEERRAALADKHKQAQAQHRHEQEVIQQRHEANPALVSQPSATFSDPFRSLLMRMNKHTPSASTGKQDSDATGNTSSTPTPSTSPTGVPPRPSSSTSLPPATASSPLPSSSELVIRYSKAPGAGQSATSAPQRTIPDIAHGPATSTSAPLLFSSASSQNQTASTNESTGLAAVSADNLTALLKSMGMEDVMTGLTEQDETLMLE